MTEPFAPPHETVRLAIGSLENALDLLGNVYSDVRDALNEFVSNAYDEIVLGRVPNGTVQVKLLPKAKPPRIVITDNGRGISRADLLRVATSIAKSNKPETRTPSLQNHRGEGHRHSRLPGPGRAVPHNHPLRTGRGHAVPRTGQGQQRG